jgi:hypothetical protein
MRELNYLVASILDDVDQAGTYGRHSFSWVFWTPIWVKCRDLCPVELNGKDLREFFDAKKANGHHKTSEESLCIFSFLFVDVLQYTTICIVQRLRQAVQEPPNTQRKCATQTVDLADKPPKSTRSCERPLSCLGQGTRYEMTHMPSAFLGSTSTTSCLSSSFHLRVFRSE